MVQTPTITLHIDELDKERNSYPLKLTFSGKKRSKTPLEWIAKDQ
jgi:hypothetical protein